MSWTSAFWRIAWLSPCMFDDLIMIFIWLFVISLLVWSFMAGSCSGIAISSFFLHVFAVLWFGGLGWVIDGEMILLIFGRLRL